MDDWLSGGLIGGIVGGIAGGMAVLLIRLFSPPKKKCPECGTPAPKPRTADQRRRMLRRGWTCRECGTEVDRQGRRVEE